MPREQGSAPVGHTRRGSRRCAILLATAHLAAASPSWAASAESGAKPSTDPEASEGFQAAASTGDDVPSAELHDISLDELRSDEIADIQIATPGGDYTVTIQAGCSG